MNMFAKIIYFLQITPWSTDPKQGGGGGAAGGGQKFTPKITKLPINLRLDYQIRIHSCGCRIRIPSYTEG